MKLPSLSVFEKKEKPQYFLSLILRDEKATAVVFEELSGVIKVVGQGDEYITGSIEDLTTEQLLETCDKIISEAETPLPKGVETQKTIFALKENWVEDNKIKKDYLEKLKKVCDELGLTPIGFLVITEAIINLLQKEEGAPVTIILAQISKENLSVSHIKASRIIETKISKIHETASFTVDTLLKHFEIPEILPAKVILLSDQDKELTQEFIHHQWSKSLPFLHLPQIVTLAGNFDIKAVLHGAAKQMGFTVSPHLMDFKSVEEIPEFDFPKDKPAEEPQLVKETEETIEPAEQEETVKNESLVESKDEEPNASITDSDTSLPADTVTYPAEHFGFMQDEDVTKTTPFKKEDEQDNFEFTKQDNFESINYKEEKETEEPRLAIIEDETTRKPFPDFKEERKPSTMEAGAMFSIITRFFGKICKFISGLMGGFKGKKIVLIPAGILIFIVLVFIYYILTLKVNVILGVSPKSEEQKQNAVFSTSSSTDVGKNIIASEQTSISEDGSTTVNATGKKETGTTAKGKITLYSRFTSDKTIQSGTVITSPSGLEFTIDDSVKVSSASADASAQPTTATVAITSKKFGKEYNLPAGTKFSVGSLETGDIIAKNDDPFSGGTKKDIIVVSKEDLAKAEEELVKDLEQKARDDISKKISSDKILLPIFTDTSVDSSTPNKKVGDEADVLTIKGTVTYKALTYSKNDLASYAELLLKNKVSSDLTIDKNNIQVEVSNLKKKGDSEISVSLDIKAALLPKIEQDKIIKKVAGMSLSSAEKEFKTLPQVVNVTAVFSPNFPFIPKFLPGDPNKIKVTVRSNG
jgi:hypothetical protein